MESLKIRLDLYLWFFQCIIAMLWEESFQMAVCVCVSVGRWKCAKWLRLLLSVSVRRTVRRVHGCLAAGAQSGSAEIEMRFSVCPRWNACANSNANAVGTSNRCGCSWKGHPICISLRQVHVCVFVYVCVWVCVCVCGGLGVVISTPSNRDTR